jgi:hypothetical protein
MFGDICDLYNQFFCKRGKLSESNFHIMSFFLTNSFQGTNEIGTQLERTQYIQHFIHPPLALGLVRM